MRSRFARRRRASAGREWRGPVLRDPTPTRENLRDAGGIERPNRRKELRPDRSKSSRDPYGTRLNSSRSGARRQSRRQRRQVLFRREDADPVALRRGRPDIRGDALDAPRRQALHKGSARPSARSGGSAGPARPGARPAPPCAACTTTSGTSECTCSKVMPPGRRSTGGSTVKSTIVDSSPMSVGPASRIRSTRPSRSSMHVRGGRRARPREPVRARRGDRNARHLHQRARHAMRRHAQRDARQSGRHEIRDLAASSCRISVSGPAQNDRPSLRAPAGMPTAH